MPTAARSPRALLAICDAAFSSTGTVGHLTLLRGDLAAALQFTVNATTDTITTATAHGLTTGSRVIVSSTGTFPAPLVAATVYYAIVLSATTLRLAATQDNAINNTPVPIDITSAGTGTLTLDEQALSSSDPLSVLIAKEVNHPAWSARAIIADLGAASVSSGVAAKSPKTIPIANTGASTLNYQHVLTLIGAGVTNAIGSIPTGTVADHLYSESTSQSIAVGETKAITLNFRSPG